MTKLFTWNGKNKTKENKYLVEKASGTAVNLDLESLKANPGMGK